jgi:polar amino acid transport system substrate-binding protein
MKNILQRLLLLALLVLPALTRADGIKEIQTRGTLRVGVCEFAPWTFTNRAGQLEGFEIDNGRQLAFDLGVTPEFKTYSLEAIFDAAEKGEIDLIAAGLAITPARALRVEFSTPYAESGTTLVVATKLAPGTTHPDALNKKDFVVGVVADTFSVSLAQQLYDVATVKSFPDAASAEEALIAGQLHGYLTSVPEANVLAARFPEQLATPLARPLVGSVSAFAVKRGNQALLNFLNAWIAARIADRSMSAYYNYWFASYDWVAHLKK